MKNVLELKDLNLEEKNFYIHSLWVKNSRMLKEEKPKMV